MLTDYFNIIRQFNRDILLFLLASSLFGFAILGGIYYALLNLYLLRLGYNAEFAGLVNGTGQVALGLCALPAGTIGRYIDTRKMIVSGLCLIFAGFGMLPLHDITPFDPASWIVGSHIIGQIGIAVLFVNSGPFIVKRTTLLERDHVYAINIAIWPISGFAGSLVGGLLPTFLGSGLGLPLDSPQSYRYALLLAAFILLPAIGVMLLTRRGPYQAAVAKPPESLKQIPLAILIFIGLVVILRVIGEGTARTFFNIYLDEHLHVSTEGIGFLLAMAQLFSIPGAMLMPILVAQHGLRRTYLIGTWGMVLSLLPLAFVPHWGAASVGFLGVMMLGGIARTTIISYQLAAVSESWQPVMSGVTSMALGLGWGIASLSGGFIVTEFGYTTLFLFGASLVAMGALLFGLGEAQVKQRARSH